MLPISRGINENYRNHISPHAHIIVSVGRSIYIWCEWYAHPRAKCYYFRIIIWYITATDVATSHCGDYNGCPTPCGDSGLLITDVTDRQYTTEMIGLPEWGIRHLGDTCSDDSRLAARYREANYWALGSHALAAQILGLKTLWKNNAFFDYHDRMFEYEGKDFLTTLAYNMWITYRANYPPVWQRHHLHRLPIKIQTGTP